MRQASAQYQHLLSQATLPIITLAVLLGSVSSGCLFSAFRTRFEQTQKAELQKTSQRFQKTVQHLWEILEHLSLCVQEMPELDVRHFRKTVSDLRLAAPLDFPAIEDLFWIQKERVLSLQSSVSEKNPFQNFSSCGVHLQGKRLIVQKNISGTAEKLIATIPLTTLGFPSTFGVRRIISGISSSTHCVPLPQLKTSLVLQERAPPLWKIFCKEHFFFLLFFWAFSFGIAGGVVWGGRRLYAMACRFLREDTDFTRQQNQGLQKRLLTQEQALNQLKQSLQSFRQAAKKREALICDVLMRQKLMREKSYITMSLLLDSADLEETDDGVGFWVKDMRNHFGFPNPELISLRGIFEQVMAVFAETIQEKQFQISIDDQMRGDVLETDRLILKIVLTNVIDRCLVRLPREGKLHVMLQRQRRGFKITLLDTGYILKNNDAIHTISRDQFYFLEPDVFENLRDSLQIKLLTPEKNHKELDSMNRTVIEVPFKLKETEQISEPKTSLPSNIIRFGAYHRHHPTGKLS